MRSHLSPSLHDEYLFGEEDTMGPDTVNKACWTNLIDLGKKCIELTKNNQRKKSLTAIYLRVTEKPLEEKCESPKSIEFDKVTLGLRLKRFVQRVFAWKTDRYDKRNCDAELSQIIDKAIAWVSQGKVSAEEEESIKALTSHCRDIFTTNKPTKLFSFLQGISRLFGRSQKQGSYRAVDKLVELLSKLHLEQKSPSSVPVTQQHQVASEMLFKAFAPQFSKINATETSTGILARIRRLIHYIAPPEYRHKIAFASEHMAQGTLAGGPIHLAINLSVELLQQVNPPPTELIRTLQEVKEINFVAFDERAAAARERVQSLRLGQSVAISSSASRHAMIMMITCTAVDKHGKPEKYKVVQHNTGEGLCYHYQRVENGKVKYQTALEIIDVSAKALCGEDFFSALVSAAHRDPSLVYSRILPMLDGTIAPPSEDPRLWSHGQLGGSCYLSACLSLIRSQLDKRVYQQFRELGRLEVLLKFWTESKLIWDDSTVKKIVMLEIVRKLERSYQKRNVGLPQELQAIARQLETKEQPMDITSVQRELQAGIGSPMLLLNGIPIAASIDAEGTIQGTSAADSLNLAFSLIKTDFQSEKALKIAVAYMRRSFDQLSVLKDVQHFIVVALKIAEFCTDRSLSVQQIVYFTELSLLIQHCIQQNPAQCKPDDPRIQKLMQFVARMTFDFSRLDMAARTLKPFTPTDIPPNRSLAMNQMLQVPGGHLKDGWERSLIN